MKKLNVGYMRVSTEAQTEKYGLDVQEDKIKELAKKRGVKIARWYVDGGYSGSNIQRPNIEIKGGIILAFGIKNGVAYMEHMDTITNYSPNL